MFFKKISINVESVSINGIKVVVFDDYDSLSRAVCDRVIDRINAKPDLVLSLPTGGTPFELYCLLIESYKQGLVSFSQVRFFQLDEYLGLSKDDPNSYYYYLNRYLFDHVDIRRENIFSFNGLTDDPDKESILYENQLTRMGPLDLVVLGIGTNGHVAFNEPGSYPFCRTRQIRLEESTIQANLRFFSNGSPMPHSALTMGLGNILEAKEVFLLANGSGKAEAIIKTLHGPNTESVPASFLQRHPNTTFFLDRESGLFVS